MAHPAPNMRSNVIQVIEQHTTTRQAVVKALRSMALDVQVATSVAEVVQSATAIRPAAVVADYDLVTAPESGWDAYRAWLCGKSAVDLGWRIPVILCSAKRLTPQRHQVVLQGDAAFLLDEELINAQPKTVVYYLLVALLAAGQCTVETKTPSHDIAQDATLRELLTQLTRSPDAPKDSNARQTDAEPATFSSVADAFRLKLPALRRPESGRIDAQRLATYLGDVALKQVADAIGERYSTVHKTPDSERLQGVLRRFEGILAMVHDSVGSDAHVRAWLQTPRSELRDKTPLEVMLMPGHISAVEDLVSGAWLGDVD